MLSNITLRILYDTEDGQLMQISVLKNQHIQIGWLDIVWDYRPTPEQVSMTCPPFLAEELFAIWRELDGKNFLEAMQWGMASGHPYTFKGGNENAGRDQWEPGEGSETGDDFHRESVSLPYPD